MSKRPDYDLAFLLTYENIAWYDEIEKKVRILDRRIYPVHTEFVVCNNHQEVGLAIKNMVTQSYGPYTAAAMGMALAASECQGQTRQEQLDYLEQAAITLSTARPTTTEQMQRITNHCLRVAKQALEAGEKRLDLILKEEAIRLLDEKYIDIEKIGRFLVDLFPQQGSVMTQCYADTVVGMMLRACREQNKDITFYCPETRPFYQGARLTASVICDMDFPVYVISDNMPAWTMHEKKIDIFTSAADVITGDGHVVNKVGTLQYAMAAQHFGIPYYCTGDPDPAHPDTSKIVIEERDSEEVLSSLGKKHTMPGVKGYYPAFDITPPEMVTRVITSRGIYKSDELKDFHK